MHSLIPISALGPGEHAEISELVGPADQVRRLEELGLRHGAIENGSRRLTVHPSRWWHYALFPRGRAVASDGHAEGIGMTRLAADLATGESGRIAGVIGSGDITRRLLEMGVTPGIELRRIGVAPLGDPLEFELRGYRLSLRKSEARQIELEPNSVA